MTLLLLLLLALLAFANGANDNGKGVATLVGYGAAKARQALVWAMVTTALGAAVSYWLAGGLVETFGAALFARGAGLDERFVIAVVAGASGWVVLATRTGLPVSTTHAITGALAGAGLATAGGAAVEWGLLWTRIVIPLAASPVAAMLLVYLVAWPVVLVLRRAASWCVCVADRVRAPAGAGLTAAAAVPALVVDNEARCAADGAPALVSGSGVANAVHWGTSGLVGFARGWNDAPKIAALAVVAFGAGDGAGTAAAFGIVTVAMAAGGLFAGRRVLETLATKVTPMPLAESLTASAVTAALVGLASWNALPVSTTHVSTGAIIGAGLKHDARAVHWAKVREIVLAWLVTLPAAALLAGAVMLLLR